MRIQCYIRFKTKEGFDLPEKAIVDTGAPISLIPFDLWRHSEVELIGEDRLRGVVPKEECSIPVNVGKIRCVLADKAGNVSDELLILAYLALTNRVPLLIGMKQLMDIATMRLDVKGRKGYIEI